MAKVRIINENAVLEVPDGSRLLDYLKEGSSLPFGCEKGECGICICTVLKGMENLNPKSHEEWFRLQKLGATPKQRLACQLWMKKGEIEIEY